MQLEVFKNCPDCKSNLPAEAFNLNPRGRLGLNTYCKACSAARTRSYVKKNHESVLKKKREYYEANKDKLLEQQRHYYQKNKPQILEAQRKPPEENRARVKAWAQANPEKRRLQGKRRVQNLSANYVRQLIRNNTHLQSEQIPSALIALKRDQMAIKRMASELKKVAKTEHEANK